MRTLTRLLLLLLTLGGSLPLWATHNRAGEIVYCVDPNNPLLYHVQIITHTKTSAPADRPELELFWGDGTSDTLPRTQIINIPGADAQQNIYEGSHLYSGPGVYILSMEDPNRNEGVLNIINSVNVPFCVKTMLVIGPLTGGNCSVRFLNSPLQDACRLSLWVHNPGAFDSDGDSLSYELIPCSGAGCATIPGYLYPNQVPASPNTFSMDPLTGTITWNTPQLIGEYNIAFRVREWRRLNNGTYQEVGWVTRDMQITVKPCTNQTPVIADLPDTCVVAGTFLAFNVPASDPDPTQSVTLTSLGGPYQVPNSPASFLSPPPANSVNGVFSWNTNCSHVRLAPWQVVFRAQDNGQPVPLENYETVNIRIVSPPPLNPSVVPQANSLLLNWDPGICTNMTGYRIYRRVGAYGFTPAHCETGVPAYTGYQFLAAVNGATTTTYTDNAVLFGVEYCYMVTAVFADGAESLASVEFCAFLDRSVPLLTHASVGITDNTAGVDTVRWTNAIDLDTLLRPGPYQFRLYRGNGFTGANTLIHTSTLHPFLLHPDTVHIDNGLDTRTGPHVYRVELYGDGGNTLIGSSDPASTVFLSAAPNDELVALSWAANTPWVNTLFTVQRFDGTDFITIATTTTPSHVDTGLVNGQTYCYRVITSGAYGDPSVVAPLINFSQEVCAEPVDLTPPCPPTLLLDNDCELPMNFLAWDDPNTRCADDTWYYHIWYAEGPDGPFTLVGTNIGSTDTTFEHRNGLSVAGCYAVTAVDSLGNESAYSNIVCGDNCPVYTLPNVFTPNGDGRNDRFVPFPYRGVKNIDLQVFNRWGVPIFSTQDPDILWDGTVQDNGEPASDGVYFYVCTVWFIRLAGEEPIQLNGYVHLLRTNPGNVN